MSTTQKLNGRRAWRKWLKTQRRKDKTSWAADIGTCRGRAAYARRHRGTNAGQGIPMLPLPADDLCKGCFDCCDSMVSYGMFYGGDPRRFKPDAESSTEAERELHKQHCEAWEQGQRPKVPAGTLEKREEITVTVRDGRTITSSTGLRTLERSAFGLGVTQCTDNQDGSYCGGKGYIFRGSR